MKPSRAKFGSERERRRFSKKIRIRKKVEGSGERPRLCVFKSLNHVYAQVIDDLTGNVLCSSTSLNLDSKSRGDLALVVGKVIAEEAKKKGIKQVVFDRNGFKYHGVIKKLADSAREAGLEF